MSALDEEASEKGNNSARAERLGAELLDAAEYVRSPGAGARWDGGAARAERAALNVSRLLRADGQEFAADAGPFPDSHADADTQSV